MSATLKPWRAAISEPWLGLNRQLTVRSLEWRLRERRSPRAYEPLPRSMLYVAASALPYHTSGYTTRTHEVIRALRDCGADVHAMTRPGYPGDRRDRQLDPAGSQTLVDDVLYEHASTPANNRPVLQYAFQAARVVAAVAARHRVAVIHAASNHVNALPALLAARSLAIPFHYEMRGLWELTRISRTPGYEGSQAARQGLQLEGLVARHADRLFVISDQLGSFAQAHWGLAADRMQLLPNCVDPERFLPADPASVEPDSVGYAGSLIGYEGLDTLIDAVKRLADAGSPVSAAIVGDGEARAELEAQVRRLGLGDRIRFHGRVPPAQARAMLARCALVCLPRKPFKVCEIVPPIKLVEALAMAKPVIVPDLRVFRDELGAEPAGWFFKAGDATDLAKVIANAFADPRELAAVGARARAYATTQRRWRDFVEGAVPTLPEEGLHGRQGH